MNDRNTCCIAGGGPAGVMVGVLLARAGVEVTVLEKHKGSFRDFRGDTIHRSRNPSASEGSILLVPGIGIEPIRPFRDPGF